MKRGRKLLLGKHHPNRHQTGFLHSARIRGLAKTYIEIGFRLCILIARVFFVVFFAHVAFVAFVLILLEQIFDYIQALKCAFVLRVHLGAFRAYVFITSDNIMRLVVLCSD